MFALDRLTALLARLRETLLCVVFMFGIGAGIFALIRRRRLTGWLAIAGFALLGVQPAVHLVGIWIFDRYPGNQTAIYLDQADLILGTLALALGTLSLILAILFAVKERK